MPNHRAAIKPYVETRLFTCDESCNVKYDACERLYAGPSLGHTVAAQVKDNGDQTFQAEFTPKMAGEHRIHVLYEGQPVSGSPFSCKVYDVTAIKVKEAAKGVVGKPVTFLGNLTISFRLITFSILVLSL